MIDLKRYLESETPVTWLFSGDSITQEAAHTRGWRGYTQLFKERLGELARNEDVVINTGVGGAGLGYLEARVEERIVRFKPDVVFIMFGTNDSAGGINGLDGYRQSYSRIVDQIKAGGIETIVIQTTVPMYTVDPEWQADVQKLTGEEREVYCRKFTSRRDAMAAYVEATRQVAEELGLPVVDHWSAWHADGVGWGQITEGGFHPNEYGHRLMVRTLCQACGIWDPTAANAWTCRLLIPVREE